jgi:hypothetical protein
MKDTSHQLLPASSQKTPCPLPNCRYLQTLLPACTAPAKLSQGAFSQLLKRTNREAFWLQSGLLYRLLGCILQINANPQHGSQVMSLANTSYPSIQPLDKTFTLPARPTLSNCSKSILQRNIFTHESALLFVDLAKFIELGWLHRQFGPCRKDCTPTNILGCRRWLVFALILPLLQPG